MAFEWWSDLPHNVLYSVGECLDAREDVLHFRSVCHPWRSSFPLPKKFKTLPMDMFFYSTHPVIPMVTPYVLTQVTVFCLEAPPEDTSDRRSWLIKVSEEVEGKYRLLYPFTSHRFTNLSNQKLLNLLNFRVSEVTKYFQLRCKNCIDKGTEAPMHSFKAELSSNFNTSNYFLVIDASRMRGGKVGDAVWKVIDGEDECVDILNYKNKFYCTNQSGSVAILNEETLVGEGIVPHPSNFMGNWYLIKSCGSLYLVGRDLSICSGKIFYSPVADCFSKKNDVEELPVLFKVYKLKEEDELVVGEWEEVTDLGAQIFVVSRDGSFSVCASDFYNCEGNVIIFVDEVKYKEDTPLIEDEMVEEKDFDDDNYMFGGLGHTRVGVFNLSDGSSRALSSCLFYANMFRPPPDSLRSTSAASSSSSSPE